MLATTIHSINTGLLVVSSHLSLLLLTALVKNRPGIPSVYRPIPVFNYTGPVFWTGPVFYTGPVSPLGIPEYYWHLHLPYMVTIYTRGELRFKDVREFVEFFRILKSQVPPRTSSYHIR